MRLFIAIGFDNAAKKELAGSTLLLKNACERGSFSRDENFHLTLVFLGEIERVKLKTITDVMDSTAVSPFEMKIAGFSRFRRDDGDILLRRLEYPAELTELHAQLYSALKVKGFTLESRKFSPHITLARRAVLARGVSLESLSDVIEPICVKVDSIYLMRSDRTGGMLTYTPLHKTVLKKDG
ncbi:MAG: RNA 2',3'-cyclic phosphodiesterase [Clostridia bacterium]|nr:RNA 2',3'-cyclic phosphodiesterase [Clostridia bacterium]